MPSNKQSTGIVTTMQAGFLKGSSSDPSITTKLPNGQGKDPSFNQVYFKQEFDPGTRVTVHLQTQTMGGSNTPGIRVMNVNRKGFQWRFNELVVHNNATSSGLNGLPTGGNIPLSDGNHNQELVGWLAVGYTPGADSDDEGSEG